MATAIECAPNLLSRPKYGITEKRDGYRGVMLLVVRSFSPSDVGTYHCVSTNSLGRAEGTLRLYGAYALSASSWPLGICLTFDLTEIKLHPGASSSNDEHHNFIGGKLPSSIRSPILQANY